MGGKIHTGRFTPDDYLKKEQDGPHCRSGRFEKWSSWGSRNKYQKILETYVML